MSTPQSRDWKGVPGDDFNTANLARDIALLPTPAVNDMGAAYTPDEWDAWTAEMKAKHNNGNGHGKSLNVEAQRLSLNVERDRLSPTPTTRDHKDTQVRREPHRPDDQGADRLRGMRDDGYRTARPPHRPGRDEQRAGEPDGPLCVVSPAPALAGGSGRADGLDFGPYSAAIERWEAVLGRQAPAPTKLNSKGNPKLSDEFDEFLMGYPAGWITDVPGVTWNETLKACGNGVVPQQGAAAVRWLVVLERAA